METKYTQEEIYNTIVAFANMMEYIYTERMTWYEQVGNLDKALSDVRHALELKYDPANGSTLARLTHEISKERRQYKNMQELFLPIFNIWKNDRNLQKSIQEMKTYKEMIENGRDYTPRMLPELFK